MTSTRQDSGQVESNTRFTIGALVLVAVLLGVGHWAWLNVFLMNTETAVERLGHTIGPAIARGEPIDGGVVQNFMAQQPRVGYVVFADYRSGYRHGVTNLTALTNSATGLADDLRRVGQESMLTRLIQPGAGFADEYLHVVSAAFVPSKESSDVTPVAVLKVGFVVPGYVAGLPPFGRGFGRVILVWWVVTGVLCVILLAFGMMERTSDRAPPPTPAFLEEGSLQNELSWLEQELENEEKYFVDHEGASWRILFDGSSLDSWKLKGSIYILDGEMVLRPWGGSAVCSAVAGEGNYIFRVYARKIAGPDGFIILFPCDNQSLAWVIGGWQNQRSEVAAYPATAKPCQLERNRWYQVDVRVQADRVEGWMDDVLAWSLVRSEIKTSSPEVGFQPGLGVATWNTLARFRDARYRTL